MADAIDFEWLGERLRATRKKRNMTLEEVAEAISISVPTLSRIERGAAKGLRSETLITLSDWMGTSVKLWKKAAAAESVPDVVQMHLRADKHLDETTADALATLFRTAYEQLRRKGKE